MLTVYRENRYHFSFLVMIEAWDEDISLNGIIRYKMENELLAS